MSAVSAMKGGRAFGRALQRGVFLALAILGLGVMAQAAVVPVKAVAAQWLLERAFDRSVAAGHPVKPWPWADTVPAARLRVERLGVSAIVLSGGSGQAMAFGPTLMPRTGDGTSIMAAHRDTHFAFVRDLRVGDRISVRRVVGKPQVYRVTAMQTVRWDRFAYPRDPVRPVLALTTCWPFGAIERGPWRRVVWAEAEVSGSFRSAG